MNKNQLKLIIKECIQELFDTGKYSNMIPGNDGDDNKKFSGKNFPNRMPTDEGSLGYLIIFIFDTEQEDLERAFAKRGINVQNLWEKRRELWKVIKSNYDLLKDLMKDRTEIDLNDLSDLQKQFSEWTGEKF